MKMTEIEMDRIRNIKFGMNGMIELEKKIGKPLTQLASESFSLENLRTILYIGLKHEHKTITEENVGDLIDTSIEKHGMNYVSEKLGEAFTKTFGNVSATPIPS